MQGKVFTASWSPDDTLTIAAAGSKGLLQIWDVSANAGARRSLGEKIQAAGRPLREREGDGLVGVVDYDDDDSEGEGEE